MVQKTLSQEIADRKPGFGATPNARPATTRPEPVRPTPAPVQTRTPVARGQMPARYGQATAVAREGRGKTDSIYASITADGIVTDAELSLMEANRDEIVIDFIIAYDVVREMEDNPKAYSPREIAAAKYILTQLFISRNNAFAKTYQAAAYDHTSQAEIAKKEERKEKGEELKLNLGLAEGAMMGMMYENIVDTIYRKDNAMFKAKSKEISREKRKQRELWIRERIAEAVREGHDPKTFARALVAHLQAENQNTA